MKSIRVKSSGDGMISARDPSHRNKTSHSLNQSHSILKNANTNTNSNAKPVLLGPIQPCRSRIPAKPDVNYVEGGEDFRCPDLRTTSSFGRQILGKLK